MGTAILLPPSGPTGRRGGDGSWAPLTSVAKHVHVQTWLFFLILLRTLLVLFHS